MKTAAMYPVPGVPEYAYRAGRIWERLAWHAKADCWWAVEDDGCYRFIWLHNRITENRRVKPIAPVQW